MTTNRLIHSTSPYLQQHAHNPVDWFEWGPEALQKAKQEDKPILVSIGYSACHWCHVMERESFEHPEIAQVMNEFFVCIKVDREERPDIDQIYMEAVQAMNQNGGWPLNVFLTPDQKPFYGGTYFPPAAWQKLLVQIHQAFLNRRNEIDTSAEDLKKHLQTSDVHRFARSQSSGIERKSIDQLFQILVQRYDQVWGGIEKAPKFVMPSIWLFVLRYHYLSKQDEALAMVTKTLTQMAQAGLYDQLAGGFARYSVDGEWFAPHFEKMLYDNAQLLSLYAEAFALTKDNRFEEIIRQTCSWLQQEMTHPKGGFYSALDADSEGVEGKFYTWTLEELQMVLGENSIAQDYYQITPEGNWEHGRNILSINPSKEEVKKNHLGDPKEFEKQLQAEKQKLLIARNKRIRPGLDDKVLSGWNAMTIVGLTDVYRIFPEEKFLTMAKSAMTFLEENLILNGKLHRSFKIKTGSTEGFLEDYAYLIQAYQKLYEVTYDEYYLQQASLWTKYVLVHFFDPQEKYFFYTSNLSEKLISRKKELFDNVIPSSNALMARNLHQLGASLERPDWMELSANMVSGLREIIEREPVYMCHWALVMLEQFTGLHEVIMVGEEFQSKRAELQQAFLPFAVFCGTRNKSDLPLLMDRDSKDDQTWIYVCRKKTCQLPVKQAVEALQMIQKTVL